jgi:hypothetical protein
MDEAERLLDEYDDAQTYGPNLEIINEKRAAVLAAMRKAGGARDSSGGKPVFQVSLGVTTGYTQTDERPEFTPCTVAGGGAAIGEPATQPPATKEEAMSNNPTTYDLIWQLRSAAIVANQAADRLEALTAKQPPALDRDGIIEACAKVVDKAWECEYGSTDPDTGCFECSKESRGECNCY